ncbi:MAG TPA: sigma-54 dependent transcriptional regulator [Candidatus Baltobacteraceae bacterium]|jgi:DNA-binding NtrC family response regulator|nr:sigma-54 dependent transcriptional regulator [Candidatus Baltobacteraceae bacterium]
MKAKVMVVDDAEEVRYLIATILKGNGYEALPKANAAELLASFADVQPDAILLDLQLPDGNGLELLPQIKKQWPDAEVIMLTGHATFDVAVEATKRGAYHFQSKPFDAKTLLLSLERALEHRRLNLQANSLHKALVTMSGGASPIFQSPSMQAVLRTIKRVAPSDVSILITGESGTGKEVVADLIHQFSPRNTGPMIKINCAALPRELIESELFGSVKGAFTGANVDREGLFRQAEGGTLLLDEISEMPIDTQSKLLRVLQEKEVRPVGGRATYKTNCRIIAATNRQTEDAIKSGKLREDLYYRISAITVDLPPLRERREDIIPLATAFLKRFDAQSGRNISDFTPAASEVLRGFEWPGNVRQLQNEIQRAVLMCEGNMVDARDLSIRPGTGAAEVTDLTLMEAMERNAILQMLKDTGGNKLETAKRLGIGRQTLYNKIKMYEIES